MERRHCSFTVNLTNDQIARVLQEWQNLENELQDLVIACDNVPSQSALETVIGETAAMLVRLAPCAPMLNPI